HGILNWNQSPAALASRISCHTMSAFCETSFCATWAVWATQPYLNFRAAKRSASSSMMSAASGCRSLRTHRANTSAACNGAGGEAVAGEAVAACGGLCGAAAADFSGGAGAAGGRAICGGAVTAVTAGQCQFQAP